ncbi:hypothetical protein CSUIS_0756 [Campylobacter porcelli]|uniref:Tetratricopeptide repeat-like domain-containing protein n=1 Tax=Campylobacter porcelli TaxID=1660073 RepID=A0A1X9SWG2_9BACT|nr:hypothetical protein CSUIS_0756 [Campylobacter sp. RM6137]
MLKLANFYFKELTLAVKENIDYIKSEISSQEQFLESAIKSERFFRKNKRILIAIFLVILIAIIAYGVFNTIQVETKIEANKAYNALINNPDDNSSKELLIAKNPSLYALFVIKTADDLNKIKLIDEALALDIDPLLKEILQNLKGNKSAKILSNYNYLIDGYELLKDGKIDEAKGEFAKIPLNSQLQPIVKNLEHYQGK